MNTGGTHHWRMPKEPPRYGMWMWPWIAGGLFAFAMSVVW